MNTEETTAEEATEMITAEDLENAPLGAIAFSDIYSYDEYFSQFEDTTPEQAEYVAHNIAGWGIQARLTNGRPTSWGVGEIWYLLADEIYSKGTRRELLAKVAKQLEVQGVPANDREDFRILMSNPKCLKNMFVFGYQGEVKGKDELAWVAGMVIYKEPRKKLVGEEYRTMPMEEYLTKFIETGGRIAVMQIPKSDRNLLSITLNYMTQAYAEQQAHKSVEEATESDVENGSRD